MIKQNWKHKPAIEVVAELHPIFDRCIYGIHIFMDSLWSFYDHLHQSFQTFWQGRYLWLPFHQRPNYTISASGFVWCLLGVWFCYVSQFICMYVWLLFASVFVGISGCNRRDKLWCTWSHVTKLDRNMYTYCETICMLFLIISIIGVVTMS